MSKADAQALLISDIHLSSEAPRCRADEKDWFNVQKRALLELHRISEERSPAIRIIAAGDIFHKWNSSPELINFALEYLPQIYAIPGQHDLPYHSLKNIEQSAYWTLVKAGKIIDMSNGIPVRIPVSDIMVHPFPFGAEITPWEGKKDKCIHLLVAHQYVWDSFHKRTGHKDAPMELSAKKLNLKGYHLALFGDNHNPFLTHSKQGTIIYNHGSLFRRSVAETHSPEVGLVSPQGIILRRELRYADKDVITQPDDPDDYEHEQEMISAFVRKLKHSSEPHFRYSDHVRRFILNEDPPKMVRKHLLASIGDHE